jgi:hypothetical protein
MVGSAVDSQQSPASLPEIRISDDDTQSTSLPLCFTETPSENSIKLPTRYERNFKRNRLFSPLLGSNTTIEEESSSTENDVTKEEISNDESSREQDLLVAIQWIRQEVVRKCYII